MKKKFTILITAALMLLTMMARPMTAWGQSTATFAPSNFSGQGTSGTGSAISATVNGVTFACDKGYGTTQIRCYSGGTITISSSNTITAISFAYSGSYTGGMETSYSNLSTTSWTKKLTSQARITECVVTYNTGGGTPTVSTPTFSPAAGTYYETQNVSIACATGDATIYYTLDGTDPTESSSVYSSAIEVSETTTIKAFATKAGYDDSEIASATYTINDPIAGYNVNFEAPANAYTDWTFTNMESQQTGNANVTAHGGTYYGTTGGKATASIQTTSKVANPGTLTCYVTKQSGNTTSSTWYIQVSSNGSSWTNVKTQDATSMSQGTWVEFSADLSSYSDVYVRVYYSGSTAVRNIDDLSLTVSNTLTVTYNANGATSGAVPTDNNEYESGDVVTVLGNTGNLAKAGYVWAGWCMNAEGTGTVYGPDYTTTFEISGNATLYAKWNAKTITGLAYTGEPTKTEYLSGESFDPTGLTVTATFNDESQEDVTTLVVWTPDPLTTGITSVTGTYMEQTINVTGLTVIAAPGTEDNPYTVAQARAAIDAGTGVTGVYVTGIVYEGGSSLSSGSMNYWISDDGTATDKFEIYKGKSFSGNDFTSTNEVQPGDIVVVYGNITKYSSTYEFSSGSSLHSLKLVAPSFSPAAGAVDEGTEITISDAHTDATIYYTTDGSTPTNESTVYNSGNKPTITVATTLKAIAVKSGCTTSDVVSAAYTIEEHAATPTFSPASNVVYTTAQNVTISCETEGATIYYTIDGTTPTNESTVYSSAIPVSETTTIKAIAVKAGMANSSVAEATYNISLTTMDAIFAKATAVGSTATSVYITFNNWVITGVNDSKHAFLSDGEKGCIIYVNDHGGFSEGNILSGTANCNVQLFNASAELTNITTATEGLTVTPGSSPTPRVTTIDALGAINSGSLVTLNDLTYNGSTLSDGENTITPYTTIYSATLTNGKTYNVTGVFVLNNTTKRINPRRAEDIVLKADMSATDFSGLTAFTYLVDNGPSAAQHIELYGEDFAGNLTVTASGDYEVSTDNTTYSESVVVAHDEGDIAKDLYVRLKSGLATGDHNGTLTFTATNLTTVEQALEGTVTASASYTITLNQNTGGTISADKETAEAGETVTLSVDVDDCYNFTGWTVLDGLANEITVTNNQFTMPYSDIEVDASFTQKTFVVTYSFNGEDIWSTSSISCGNTTDLLDEDDLETLEVVIPSGFYFQGWSEAQGSTTLVSSPYTPTSNITLYAVLTYGESETYYARVTSDLGTDWAGDYLIAYSDEIFADGRVGGKDDTGAIGKANVKVNLSSYISGNNIPATNGDTYKVTLEEISENSNTYVLKTQDGKYNYQSSNNNGLSATDNKETASAYPITVTFTSANDIKLCLGGSAEGAVFRFNDGNGGTNDTYFRYYKNGGQSAVYLYKRTASEAPNFNVVTNVTSTTSMSTDIPENTCVIVNDGSVLTFTGTNNGNASNLIIEDGGQLIHDNPVNATIQRNVTGHSNSKDNDNSGYQLIASPVESNLDVEAQTNLTEGDYDLYYFDHSYEHKEWRNYKKTDNPEPFTSIKNGIGYLYANTQDITISFSGELKPSLNVVQVDLAYVDGKPFSGWNLVGNPFACNAYIIGATEKVEAYYKMNDNGNGFVASTDAIDPMEGIFVQASATDQSFFFTRNEPSKGVSNLNLQVAQVTNSRDAQSVSDNAIIRFDGGNTLEKFSFSEDNAKLYIPQNGKDYAVVSSDTQGEMPVNFKAAENGTYTIDFSMDNVEFSYLHLIDNKTGMDIDLLQTSSYTFEASKIDYASRFKLVFSTNSNSNSNDDNDFAFFDANGNLLILGNEGTATLQVIDITGRTVSNETFSGNYSKAINAKAGVYMLRLIQGNDVRTQKIVVR